MRWRATAGIAWGLGVPLIAFGAVLAMIWILPLFGQECFGESGPTPAESPEYCIGPLGPLNRWTNDHAIALTATLSGALYALSAGRWLFATRRGAGPASR